MILRVATRDGGAEKTDMSGIDDARRMEGTPAQRGLALRIAYIELYAKRMATAAEKEEGAATGTASEPDYKPLPMGARNIIAMSNSQDKHRGHVFLLTEFREMLSVELARVVREHGHQHTSSVFTYAKKVAMAKTVREGFRWFGCENFYDEQMVGRDPEKDQWGNYKPLSYLVGDSPPYDGEFYVAFAPEDRSVIGCVVADSALVQTESMWELLGDKTWAIKSFLFREEARQWTHDMASLLEWPDIGHEKNQPKFWGLS